MKNVLVLYSKNLSSHTFGHLGLKNVDIGDLDSSYIFKEQETKSDKEFAKSVLLSLQSDDGIQCVHFMNTMPNHDATKPPTERNIEYWVEKLKASFKEGETLDALVIPAGNLENKYTLRWIKELKQQFPTIKVMSENPYLGFETSEPNKANRFAYPKLEKNQLTTMVQKKIIKNGDPDYVVADGIDVVTYNIKGDDFANVLRDLLGMKHIKTQAKGWAI